MKCRIKKDCPMGGMCNPEKELYQATIFPIVKRRGFILESQLEIGNTGLQSYTLFSTLYSETKQPYQGSFGV